MERENPIMKPNITPKTIPDTKTMRMTMAVSMSRNLRQLIRRVTASKRGFPRAAALGVNRLLYGWRVLRGLAPRCRA